MEKKRVLFGFVMTIVAVLAVALLGGAAWAEEEEPPPQPECPPDATIEVKVGGCLYDEDGVIMGRGAFGMRNVGSYWGTWATAEASFVEGDGTIEPVRFTTWLPPEGEDGLLKGVAYTAWPSNTLLVTDTVTINLRVIGSTVLPEDNIGISDTFTLPPCPPTAVELIENSFTATWQEEPEEEEEQPHWSAPYLGSLACIGMVIGIATAIKRTK